MMTLTELIAALILLAAIFVGLWGCYFAGWYFEKTRWEKRARGWGKDKYK